jgi:alpha-tubulin suppressor-like RCC1 family protein
MGRFSHLWSLCIVAAACGCKSSSEVGEFSAHDDGGTEAATESGVGGAGGTGGAITVPPVLSRLALGSSTTCAIDSQAAVKCWGGNTVGQLGIGDMELESSQSPVVLSAFAPGAARALFGGAVAECAVLHDGHVACWGDSVFGEFPGEGAVHAITFTPLDAPGLSSVVSVAVGTYFHCALNVEGGVKCYGLNSAGQLGIGSLDDSFAPQGVDSAERFTQLTASQSGFFACATSSAGAAYCWGSNAAGALGTGLPGDETSPHLVFGLDSGVTSVSAGRDHACALIQGSVRCWGRNVHGQLGNGVGPDQATPIDVPGLPPVVEITSGVAHTCVLTNASAVHCWGSSESGNSPAGPEEVIAGGVVEVRAGGHHTCALFGEGALRCWGENFSGQLGPFSGPGAPF